MRVKQVDSWNGQRERILDDEKKRAEAYSFVQRISRRAHPVPSRGFLSFLRPIDYPRYYLLSRLSTVSLRTCGLSLERKRERENGVSRTLPKTGRGDITEGDHQSCASPGTWICLFFHSFLFPSPLLLDKIQWNKWKGDDKSCPPIASYSGLRL